MSTAYLLHSIDVYASQLKNVKIEMFTEEIYSKNLFFSRGIVDKFVHLQLNAQKIFAILDYYETANFTIMKTVCRETPTLSTSYLEFLLERTIDIVNNMRDYVALEKPWTTQNAINYTKNQGSELQTALQDFWSEALE
jgi:hypothetical protein